MRNSALFVFVVFARFWPDSARTKHPTAKMAATQKINRAAFDIFILLVFSMRQHSGFSCGETQLTLCGSVLRILRTRLRTGKQNLKATAAKPINCCN
jgi:hypothetical protein